MFVAAKNNVVVEKIINSPIKHMQIQDNDENLAICYGKRMLKLNQKYINLQTKEFTKMSYQTAFISKN